MSDTSKLTIIIPTVGESTLEAAIAECRLQAPEAEILVAGARFDPNMVKKYSATPILLEHPASKPTIMNLTYKIAKNDYRISIDADALPRPGWAEAITSCFEEGKEIFSGSVDISEGNFWMRVYNISFFHLFTTDKPAGPRNFVVGCNYAMTKETYLKNGLFDETLERSGDDYEYCLRAVSNGIQPWFNPTPVLAHIPVTKNTFKSVMKFWFDTGYPTIKVRAAYPQLTNTPWLLRNPWFVLFFSPILALVPTYRVIHSRKQEIFKELQYLPFIYLTKIAWCVGLFVGAMRDRK